MSGDELELRVAWERYLGRSPVAGDWLEAVLRRHRESTRHYHGVHHVAWAIRHVLVLADRLDVADVGAIVAAAAFHDVVYDPARSDNEAVSARLAERALGEIGWDDERRSRVAAMIRATAGHALSGDLDLDTRVLLAADLAVLATDPARYQEYVLGVRNEHAHVAEPDWRRGRAAVLNGFLARDHIFDPALGLADWERRARANLTAELAGLEA